MDLFIIACHKHKRPHVCFQCKKKSVKKHPKIFLHLCTNMFVEHRGGGASAAGRRFNAQRITYSCQLDSDHQHSGDTLGFASLAPCFRCSSPGASGAGPRGGSVLPHRVQRPGVSTLPLRVVCGAAPAGSGFLGERDFCFS